MTSPARAEGDRATDPTVENEGQRGTDRIRDAWERRPETWLSTVILVVIVINWFWWGAERASVGGSALGGYVSEGRYFLSSDGTFA